MPVQCTAMNVMVEVPVQCTAVNVMVEVPVQCTAVNRSCTVYCGECDGWSCLYSVLR